MSASNNASKDHSSERDCYQAPPLLPFEEVYNEAVNKQAKHKSEYQRIQDKDHFDILGNKNSEKYANKNSKSEADIGVSCRSHPAHKSADE